MTRDRWPPLLGLERLVGAGRLRAARSRAAALCGRDEWIPRAVLPLLWSCPACAGPVLRCLEGVVVASGRRQHAAIRWVLSLLAHPDEAVRAGALGVLATAAVRLDPATRHRRWSPHLPVLRRMTEDPSRAVRRRAVALLGQLRDRRAHGRLLTALTDPSPVVRRAAVRALAAAVGLVPGAPTTWAVCRALTDPAPAVRAAALDAVARAPQACPLGRVARLLGDASRLWLRLRTVAGGDRGLLLSGGQVREHALAALPATVRAGTAPGALGKRPPLDLRIQRAVKTLESLGLPRPAPLPALRPQAPLPAGPAETASDPEEARYLRSWLDGQAADRSRRAGRPTLLLRLQVPATRAALGALLPALPDPQLRLALDAVSEMPLSGPLLAGVVRLLGHRKARWRRRALCLLELGTQDDWKRPVLRRALWLSRRDPSGPVRARALALLWRWHAGLRVLLRVAHALGDPAPAVRLQAARALFGLCEEWFKQGEPALGRRGAPGQEGALCWQARARLRAALPAETDAVLGEGLALFIRGPGPLPEARWVARVLGRLRPTLRATRARVAPTGGPCATLERPALPAGRAVILAIEARFGVRHRGEDAARARRWQRDLERAGWPRTALDRPRRDRGAGHRAGPADGQGRGVVNRGKSR